MADTTIATIGDASQYVGTPRYFVSTSSNNIYMIYYSSTAAIVYRKSTDGGASFGSEVTIRAAGTDLHKIAIWADWWTPGDAGTNIHICFMATGVVRYNSLDTSNDTLSGEVAIDTFSDTGTGSASSHAQSPLSIVKSRGGNLYVAWAMNSALGPNDSDFFRSTDNGASWSARATPWESNIADRIILLPGDAADTNDIIAAFADVSADELDRKNYDDSGNSWATTNIAAGMNINVFSNTFQFAAAPRHSDNLAVVIAHNAGSASTNDLQAWEIGSATVNALTNVFTNEANHIGCNIVIDQITDNIYAFFAGDPGETFATALNIHYRVSTDGGTTWSSATQYSQGSAGSFWEVYCDISVGGTRSGLVGAVWVDTATSGDTLYFNAVNAIVVTSNAAVVADLTQIPGVIVDFNQNGAFDSSEDISSYVLNMDWNRGKEPEQETTPAGTGIIKISDPTGIFVPDSTFWGTDSNGKSNIDIGREVFAVSVYNETTYSLFRGRISRMQAITRPGNDQVVTFFITDEKGHLAKNKISHPDVSPTSGGANPDPDDPVEGILFGSTGTSVIGHILDESSVAIARRQLSEGGSTADLWWVYDESGKASLDDVERHEGKNSMLFINSSGSFVFHSSTHRNGSTAVAKFGKSTDGAIPYQSMKFELSDRNILNAAEVTILTRVTQEITIQGIPEPNVAIAQGSAYSWTVPLDNAPVGSVGPTPLAERDSTDGVSIRGAGGTTYSSDSHSSIIQTAVLGGGSAVRFTVTNDTTIGETISIHRPASTDYSGSTGTFPLKVQLHAISNIDRESCDPASINKYGRIAKSITLPFFGSLDAGLTTGGNNAGKASDRATAEIAHNSTAHADAAAITIEGTDSDSISQILTREMNDRIRVNDTQFLHLTDRDFYITRGEWSMAPGGHISAIWSLQEATGT